ncbi:MAG: hypothetical protein R3F30_06330 [Planctomycetota bacterium]
MRRRPRSTTRRASFRATALAAGILASAAAAQSGAYATYGTGCSGSTPGQYCAANNPTGGTANPLVNINNPQLAMLVATQRKTLIISSFELYTKAPQQVTVPAWIYLPDGSGKPAASPIGTGSLTVGTTLGWHKATFTTPVVVSNKPVFFLSWSPGTGNRKALAWPWLQSGTNAPYCWRDQPLSGAWKGPSAGQPWAWRVTCIGGSGQVPTLSAKGTPSVGGSFTVLLDQGLASAPTLLLFGGSASAWGPFKLPLDLSPAGASGCDLLCSFDLPVALQCDANGQASLKVPVPNDGKLVNAMFHNQWIVLDAKANKLGLAFSDGGTGTIGP